MREEQFCIKLQHGLASLTKPEMSGFDDSHMDRPYWYLKDALAMRHVHRDLTGSLLIAGAHFGIFGN